MRRVTSVEEPLPPNAIGTFGVMMRLAAERKEKGAVWCRKFGVGEMRRMTEAPAIPRNMTILTPSSAYPVDRFLEVWGPALKLGCKVCGGCPLARRDLASED